MFWIVLLVGVGLNSSGDSGNSSCWELVLVLVVGLSWGELGLGTWAGLGVGLNSRGQWVHLWFIICTGHARCYREEQPESAVWRLLYSVDVGALHLRRLR